MIYKKILPIAVIIFTISTGFAQKLTTGAWRGALTTSSAEQIPFNFEVTDNGGKQQIDIINGSEHFKVTDITTKGDSVFIKMPLFDSEFKLKRNANGLAGSWIKHGATSDVSTPFKATPGTKWRFFEKPAKPQFNIDGRWSAVFGEGDGKESTVGEFKQNGQTVTGTFLTTTGDYRFLEGLVAGDSLYLSCFDGGHAYLFKAKINDDKTITNGKFFSGLTGTDVWTAVKDPDAKLPDAYSLTALKPGYKKLDFSFTDLQGNKVSPSDDKYKGKVVIVQILGSWCPNCMDETAYMVDYYKKYQSKGVEVIGLAYERTKDRARSERTVKQLQQRFNIPYPLLITGYTPAKDETAQSLPALAKVVGFPTTIIIDKKGDVRKIHTGFSGPATGEHYTEFISEFEKLTDDLLAEK
ncbi:TlpA family protein disulfide reductase [Mucilaginibacter limnophilus]|uniref:TlpA family protein disulfide reductase n=1 Tax=Mucilaginibacter limnophilus TaxID=1932778 RepID=A0A3S2Y203_9SPHI|nr:TlpA disulfide reductase family protein [Mucilaginibacter limnophilus]RVU01611.1 TlpA family protein disulfide reductase [Mucilaginibacter limnophilus]